MTSPSPKPSGPGVVLLNFGGPRNLQEVRPFLREIFRDPHVLQLPFPQAFQEVFAWVLAKRRAKDSAAQYALIGGSSPTVAASQAIADKIAAGLREKGLDLPLWVDHRYLPGWSADLARKITASGVQNLFFLPLYPQFSFSTTGSSLAKLSRELWKKGFAGTLKVLPSAPTDEGYLLALGEILEDLLRTHALDRETTTVLCSAHGLPQAYVDQGDPYEAEIRATFDGLQARFPAFRMQLSYQSRVGPREWLRPYTRDAILALGREGRTKAVVMVPLSFVNEHIETLYELDQLYLPLVESQGMKGYRCGTVDSNVAYLRSLTEKIREFAEGNLGESLEPWLPGRQKRHRRKKGFWPF